jgi:Polyketide cyclase / dehydrase and lipid transport
MLKIVLGVLAAVAALVVTIQFQPAEFSVERSLEVNAPAAAVFDQVNDYSKWEAWSPWAKKDPNMKMTLSTPSAGEGASQAWEGNNDVGTGKQTIVKSVPNSEIEISLDFEKPMNSKNTVVWTFAEMGASTKATWKMSGTNNFVGKAFGLFMNMDKMIGDDFDKGLAQLKTVAEAQTARAAQ